MKTKCIIDELPDKRIGMSAEDHAYCPACFPPPANTPTPYRPQFNRPLAAQDIIDALRRKGLDAAFIVKAVNNYESLLNACKEFMAARNELQFDEAAQSIKEAIAKAEVA